LDLAVVPSHSENCGGAIEPLLSCVPVVATNVGGLPDLVQNGKTGWLVPPRNPEELAHAILEALQNPAEGRRRAKEGQKLARSMFEVKTTGREVAAMYEKVPGVAVSIKLSQTIGSPIETVQTHSAVLPSQRLSDKG
jgi:glycosyltransferase involved in cell wall biosynthesis